MARRPPLDRLTVMVVDDSQDNVYSLSVLLEAFGLHVISAYSGQEAMEVMRKAMPNVIVTDITMPGVDGLQLCRWMRQQPGGSAPVAIALTGWTRLADRQAARQAGFDHYFVKPADIDQVLDAIAQGAAAAKGRSPPQ